MKKKPLLRIPLGEGRILYRSRVESSKSDEDSKDAQRVYFLSTIFNTPNILDCGPGGFDTLRVFFEDGGWVAVCEAEVIEEP